MSKNKKSKTLIIIIALLLIAVISAGIWLIVVDKTSRSAGLIELNVNQSIQKSGLVQEESNIDINGITMHYSVCGQGYPLILLHGNGGSHSDFDNLIEYLSNDYEVFALDSRCQGESTGNEISYELMAQDTAVFIETMGLDHPIIFGHSDGGIVGLLLAINYPDSLCGLISGGANSNPNGLKWYSLLETKIAYAIKNDALDKMMIEEPNITADNLKSINVPTYIIAGEFDIIRLSDTKFISSNIEGSEIGIIKGGSHSSYTNDGKKGYVLISSWIEKTLL
ncbi:MAG: alpha/beta hydrolase [Clostridia bacterium]